MTMDTILLLFFALPIAVVVISVALQKILRCPILVAAIIFAIFLIVTFVVGDTILLIAAIAYAILSYITAFLVCVICRFLNSFERYSSRCRNSNNNNNNNNDNNSNNDLVTISNIANNLNNSGFNNNNNNNNNGCGCNNNNNNQVLGVNGVSARINVIPNNNGATGNITGCYRSR